MMYKINTNVITTYFKKNIFNIFDSTNVLVKLNSSSYKEISHHTKKRYHRSSGNYNDPKEYDIPKKYFIYASGGFLFNFFKNKDPEEDDEHSIIMTIKRSILLIQVGSMDLCQAFELLLFLLKCNDRFFSYRTANIKKQNKCYTWLYDRLNRFKIKML